MRMEICVEKINLEGQAFTYCNNLQLMYERCML